MINPPFDYFFTLMIMFLVVLLPFKAILHVVKRG